MKVEIYGVSKDIFPCHGCITAEKIMQEVDIAYDFVSVIDSLSDEGIPSYNRSVILQLAERIGQKSLSIMYPVIFIDDERIFLKDLRNHLTNLGYDAEL